MKNIILLCLSMAALASFAQTCKISGTLNMAAVKEAGGKTHSYPTYVIIDKDGKIITPNAEQPADREKISAQPDKFL